MAATTGISSKPSNWTAPRAIAATEAGGNRFSRAGEGESPARRQQETSPAHHGRGAAKSGHARHPLLALMAEARAILTRRTGRGQPGVQQSHRKASENHANAAALTARMSMQPHE